MAKKERPWNTHDLKQHLDAVEARIGNESSLVPKPVAGLLIGSAIGSLR